MIVLLDFCRYAQRMGASRRIAYRTWEARNPNTSFEEFCTFWASARQLEKQKAQR